MNQPVCIITGAGGGIGRAIAVELSRLGYRTVLVGRTVKTLQQTANLLEQPSLVCLADVTRPLEVESVVGRALMTFGQINALVNNAGVAPVLSVEQTSPTIWHEVMDTNVSAAFYFSRAVWEAFRKQNSGVIVNISSMAAKDPFPGFLAYGAAKAALNNLGISLAREGASMDIRVHTIAPGAVETEMFRKILSPEQFPTENTLAPQEVAAVVGRCVIGDDAYRSGHVIWLSK